MEEKRDLKKELISSLENLRQSFLDLNYLWDDIKGSENKGLSDFMEDSMPKDYPFPISFDDMTGYVGSWVEDRIDDLKSPLFDCRNNVNAIMDNFEKLSSENKNLLLEKLVNCLKYDS